MPASSDELKVQISDLQKQIKTLQSQKVLLETLDRQLLAPEDPDARVMKTKDGFLPAYNIQTTVDNDAHLITSCEATDYPNDFHSLEENARTVKEQPGIVPETHIAAGGDANEERIQSLETDGIDCIVPFPDESESKKVQRENGITFTYDERADCFRCSQGKSLLPVGKNCKKRHHFTTNTNVKNALSVL